MNLFGPLPSFQRNLSTLDSLRRQLTCEALPSEPPYEKRYPYLDRCLLEFTCAIPRTQLVRPGQRRSLMRRALAGIVPGELLNRKRKAFLARAPMTAISAKYGDLIELGRQLESGSLGIVDAQGFQEVLQKVRMNQEVPIINLLRTISFEIWLRNLRGRKGLKGMASAGDGGSLQNARGRNPAIRRENSA